VRPRSVVYLIAPLGWVGMRDRIKANLTTVITTNDHCKQTLIGRFADYSARAEP
jgi:hypothetical protein